MRIFILTMCIFLGAILWLRREVSHPDGIMIRQEPLQVMLEDAQPTVERHGFVLRPLAGYIVEGRVLRTKHYLTDPVHALAPYDVAMGWGKMSDSAVLAKLKIDQGNRFFFWEYKEDPPILRQEMERSAGNCHLIAANKGIAREIAWLRRGELIRIEGSLIEATGPDGRKWRSSLRRDDTGNGACEIIWVSKLTKLETPHR